MRFLMIDFSEVCLQISKQFAGPERIDHAKDEYVNSALRTNSIELSPY